ncbi:MAG: hypothetical protein HY084_06635 [Gemmatimonadetes bacterium]|nr:hypothetical protein [Gemmatimonadota bacterium]
MRPIALAAFLAAAPLAAQANYEIQIYPSATQEKGTTLFELHSNYTGTGTKTVENGVLPTDGVLHNTLEITHGFSDIFELGFYVFTSARAGDGWQVAGSHIRPRVRAPEGWKLPVGLSLSAEVGPTQRKFDQAEWGVELRPIVDQTVGRFYWSVNPTIGWALKGDAAGRGYRGMEFEPSGKVAWQLVKEAQVGIEYYGTTGTITRMASSMEQQHMLYPSVDLTLSEEWEFNAGYGFQLSGSGDRNILKVILGRRFGF